MCERNSTRGDLVLLLATFLRGFTRKYGLERIFIASAVEIAAARRDNSQAKLCRKIYSFEAAEYIFIVSAVRPTVSGVAKFPVISRPDFQIDFTGVISLHAFECFMRGESELEFRRRQKRTLSPRTGCKSTQTEWLIK